MNRKFFARWLAAGLIVCLCAMVGTSARAGVTNIIWQATASGMLGIQSFRPNVQPSLQSAPFNTKNLLRMMLGRDATKGEVLAVNVDMFGNTTNIFLSVFDKTIRQNVVVAADGGTTTLISDGKKIAFAADSGLLSGMVRLAGQGKMSHGVPAGLRASMGGWVVDPEPSDLGGTTGLVLRARISTTGKILRAQPPVAQD